MQVVETTLLKPVATATTAARTEPIDLDQFFRIRPGLYLWDSFRERFDLGASSQSRVGRPYVASLLKSSAFDRNICQELPESHLSTPEDIAGFIEAQTSGEKGFLLTNGYANVFYVLGKNGQIVAVSVRWSSDNRAWYVHDYGLGEGCEWNEEGCRVLSRGNATLRRFRHLGL